MNFGRCFDKLLSYNIIKRILFFPTLFFLSYCDGGNEELKIYHSILKDSSNFFYTDFNGYKQKNPQLPIGIFDSGTGGLTVFDAIVNFDKYNNTTHQYSSHGDSVRDFSRESFIYLADQANMPYGNYDAHSKSHLLKEHVIKDAQFLLSNKYYSKSNNKIVEDDKSSIKALVIACNTATAIAKNEVEELIKNANVDLKVIGVIGAGVRAALKAVGNEEKIGIGILATAGTVKSNGYVTELKNQLVQKGVNNSVEIFQQAGIGLAGAIDETAEFIDHSAQIPRNEYKGPSDVNNELIIKLNLMQRYQFNWVGNNMLYEGTVDNPSNIQINSVENYISFYVTTLLEQIILQGGKHKLRSIILGCTHYPFYIDVFRNKIENLRNYKENGSFIYRDILADQIEFIDPAIYTAMELYEYLISEKLIANNDLERSEFYISVPNIDNKNIETDQSGNFIYDFKYGRSVNEIQEYVKRVPFNNNNIPSTVQTRLKEKIPFTFNLIRKFNSQNPKVAFLKDEEKIK